MLFLLPTATYRARDFLEAAARVGVEVVVGSEHRQAMARAMGRRAVVVPFGKIDAAVEVITELSREATLDAILAVDDQGLAIAAAASARLGLPHNPVEAVAATRDKSLLRARLAGGPVAQPEFRLVAPGGSVTDAARHVGYPCVVKPVSRSGSQGVIRADDPEQAAAAAARIRAIVGRTQPLLVERFVPGAEVAVEAIVVGGALEVLAVFDKPDPLDGPFFEETIYVTPSRLSSPVLGSLTEAVAASAACLGLHQGPVHAELRIGPDDRPVLVELAARSIGGLCARALRFGAGVSLEELIVRNAAGLGIGELRREAQASGVMMLPIRSGGVLEGVSGTQAALAVEGVVGLEISIATGRPVVPLPEGDRYLGFVFARGPGPAEVERSLRRAEAELDVVIRPGP